MGKREEIDTTNGLVKQILQKYPIARNSDDYLYVRVIKAINPKAAEKPFVEVMENLKDLGLPCYETVGRCRRKIQEQHPELRSDDFITRCRENNEEAFKDYANS